jgi:hypothetical protein
MKLGPVVFSGYNDRAIISLFRYFSSIDQEVFIIASSKNDFVYHTKWKSSIIHTRDSDNLDLELFEKIAISVLKLGYEPTIISTSEFLNHYILNNRFQLEDFGFRLNYPEKEIYDQLSNKHTSHRFVHDLNLFDSVKVQEVVNWKSPCVLKPKKNIVNNKSLKPIICLTDEDLEKSLKIINLPDYDCFEYVEGQSYYLCSYIDKRGKYTSYWQINLLQQSQGGSILLAKNCINPGVNSKDFMKRIIETGYFGPFMAEFIISPEGKRYFIEINPRFWGPLELAHKIERNLFHRFHLDIQDSEIIKESTEVTTVVNDRFYAWAYGLKSGKYKEFPAFRRMIPHHQLFEYMDKNDVYNQDDTKSLFKKH